MRREEKEDEQRKARQGRKEGVCQHMECNSQRTQCSDANVSVTCRVTPRG